MSESFGLLTPFIRGAFAARDAWRAMLRAKGDEPAASSEDVYAAEIRAIEESRARRGVSIKIPEEGRPSARIRDGQAIGLAFSGGGIRSATFNLGILQGLAKWKILHSVDYLSTVSGGGYIGSWLHAWIQRRGIDEVAAELAADMPDDRDGAPDPIHFIRRYANYLSPSAGMLSADTWTIFTVWLRNTVLNQLILIMSIAAMLLLPRAAKGIVDMAYGSQTALWLALLLTSLAMVFMGLNLSSFDDRDTLLSPFARWFRKAAGLKRPTRANNRWFHQNRVIQFGVVIPMLLVALLLSSWFAFFIRDDAQTLRAAVFVGVMNFGFLVLLSVVGGFELGFAEDSGAGRGRGLAACLVFSATSAACGSALAYYAGTSLSNGGESISSWDILTWGTPITVLWFAAVIVIQMGLLGRAFTDDRREWVSRLGAWLFIYLVLWCAIFVIAIQGPRLLLWIHSKVDNAIATGAFAGWFGAVAAGLWSANNSKTGEAGNGSPKAMSLVAKLAPAVFIFGVLVFISLGIHFAALKMIECPNSNPGLTLFCAADPGKLPPSVLLFEQHYRLLDQFPEPVAFLAAVALFAAALLLAWRVDINEFSLHQFYRNRLVRCYLGASRDHDRSPNLFTGFDPDDDIHLASLSKDHSGPYPIINTAMNLVHGENLAWQERKAQSFIFTPAYCGYNPDDGTATHEPDYMLDASGYRLTSKYGGGQICLGQAVAISGAAASPNAGYHSSPAAAFLMTMFDVRLGWWIGNPRHQIGWRKNSPGLGLFYLICELLGVTNDRRSFVYLSDGGHFENLAVYELIRRRCPYIIACDAEQDSAFSFEGLGNLIRKCRTDFGVDIDIDAERLRPGSDGYSGAHCVVGTIRYPNGTPPGVIVYIKSSLTGDEPADVLEHRRRDATFPHTSTADQWFDESQFESYRRLGVHVANTVFRNVAEVYSPHAATERSFFFRKLYEQWYPPARSLRENFSEHGRTLSNLMRRIGREPDLAFLLNQVTPEWEKLMAGVADPPEIENWLPNSERELRAGLLFMNEVIQLMENVYIELDLEQNWAHPDARGWMNLFNHFVWSSMFRVTWAVSASTYGARFQTFCEKRLQLTLGTVQVRIGSEEELNFYERLRFREFSRPGDSLWRIEIHVRSLHGDAKRVVFPVGFALRGPDRVLHYVRIMNHVRKMGLWARARRFMWSRGMIAGEEFQLPIDRE